MLGVVDLGMKLDCEDLARRVLDRGDRAIVGGGRDNETRRDAIDAIAMAHPNLKGFGPREEMALGPSRDQGRPAVFALRRRLNVPAKGPCQGLQPIADAQDRLT